MPAHLPFLILTAIQSVAQPTPQASPSPQASQTPPVEIAPPVVVATPTPSPVESPVVLPTPTQTSPVADASPVPRAVRTPEPVRRPRPPVARSTPETEPVAAASPAIRATPAPAPAATPGQAIAPAEASGGGRSWWWAMALAAVVAGALLWWRRRGRWREEQGGEGIVPEPEIVPAPAPVPVRGVAPELNYRPMRIGLNLISATVEGALTFRNPAAEPMADVRVRVALLGVSTGHEAVLAALHREAGGRLLTPPFVLGAGETRVLRAVAGVARTAIEPLQAGGRTMFVPMVAVIVEWRDGGGEHRRTQAFAVGVERVDSPRLAPVWLDEGARNYDAVAARVHGAALG